MTGGSIYLYCTTYCKVDLHSELRAELGPGGMRYTAQPGYYRVSFLSLFSSGTDKYDKYIEIQTVRQLCHASVRTGDPHRARNAPRLINHCLLVLALLLVENDRFDIWSLSGQLDSSCS